MLKEALYSRLLTSKPNQVDYRLVMDDRWKWDAMSAEKFVEMISSNGFLGDPLVKTQHLLGATVWESISDTEVIGHHQLRAAHLRFTGPDMQRVDRRGHSHATNEHFYRKVNGVWKFAGLRPNVRLNEFDFDKIFKGIEFDEVPNTTAEKAGDSKGLSVSATIHEKAVGGIGTNET